MLLWVRLCVLIVVEGSSLVNGSCYISKMRAGCRHTHAPCLIS